MTKTFKIDTPMITKIALTFFGHCKVPKVDLEKSHFVEVNLLSQESSESFSVFFVDKHEYRRPSSVDRKCQRKKISRETLTKNP